MNGDRGLNLGDEVLVYEPNGDPSRCAIGLFRRQGVRTGLPEFVVATITVEGDTFVHEATPFIPVALTRMALLMAEHGIGASWSTQG